MFYWIQFFLKTKFVLSKFVPRKNLKVFVLCTNDCFIKSKERSCTNFYANKTNDCFIEQEILLKQKQRLFY